VHSGVERWHICIERTVRRQNECGYATTLNVIDVGNESMYTQRGNKACVTPSVIDAAHQAKGLVVFHVKDGAIVIIEHNTLRCLLIGEIVDESHTHGRTRVSHTWTYTSLTLIAGVVVKLMFMVLNMLTSLSC
jgi:hypothetical protein